jgi:heptosyltransferase III
MLFSKYNIRFQKTFFQRFFASFIDLFYIRRKKSYESPKNILVIRKDEIGDLILSIPIYENLKKNYPRAKISVIASKRASVVLEKNPNIDEIIYSEDLFEGKSGLSGVINASKKLKERKFDLGIDPKGSIVNILLMYLSKIKQRISYYNVSGGKMFLTGPIFYNEQVHEIDSNLNLLEKSLGLNVEYSIPKIYLTAQETKDAEKFLKDNNLRDYCCVYSVPSKVSKMWRLENFKKVVQAFPRTKFVFIGVSGDKDKIESIIDGCKNCISLYNYDLRKLYYVFKMARAILSVDGGPMHLVWIANKNVVALFGQNDIELWVPKNSAEVICHFPKEKQGINRQIPDFNKENKYMDMISVDEVIKKLGEGPKSK